MKLYSVLSPHSTQSAFRWNLQTVGKRSIWWLLIFLIIPLLGACVRKSNASMKPVSRLSIIKNRGVLICGVNGQLPGFSYVDSKGKYSGMDVDICRAIAAAVLNDHDQIQFRNLSSSERFTALATGEVDILIRNTTQTISRDTSGGMEFAPTTFYDGQGIMVPVASGTNKVEDLSAKSICVRGGSTTELNLSDQMRQYGIAYTPVVFDKEDSLYAAYLGGRCDAVTADRSQLVAHRANFSNSDAHVVLDTVLSKEPLGPVVASGDNAWFDAVKWITYALIQAEEFGITSKNYRSFQKSSDPSIRSFLGLEGSLGEDMGLPIDFAARIVKHVGNYGEIYDRNIGKPLGLERGLNQLWSNGGLLYSPPFH